MAELDKGGGRGDKREWSPSELTRSAPRARLRTIRKLRGGGAAAPHTLLWLQCWASPRGGCSHCAAQAYSTQASAAAAHGLYSTGSGVAGTWTWLCHGALGRLGPGTEPMSSALAGSFPATEPPGRPLPKHFKRVLAKGASRRGKRAYLNILWR